MPRGRISKRSVDALVCSAGKDREFLWAVAEEHDDGKHVSPIPADAPDVPKTHCRFGRPTTTSVYRDEQGATLFRVLRFDPPASARYSFPCRSGAMGRA